MSAEVNLAPPVYARREGCKTMDAAIGEAFARLKLLKVFDFYKARTLTQEQQGWVHLICDRYLEAPLEEQESIRSLVKPETSFVFFMYAAFKAEQAVRERDEEKVLQGLLASSIENQVFDWRDSMMVLVRLHHSALKISANPSKLFRRVAAISSSQTSEYFLRFLSRPSEDLDLAKFGLKEGTDSDGNFAYVPGGMR